MLKLEAAVAEIGTLSVFDIGEVLDGDCDAGFSQPQCMVCLRGSKYAGGELLAYFGYG